MQAPSECPIFACVEQQHAQAKMTRLIFLILVLLSCTTSYAQWSGVIVNMETGIPIRDVHIFTNYNKMATTDYRGNYTLEEPFTSVTITHGKFLQLTLKREELRDTIALLPSANSIGEVVIWGEMPRIGVKEKEIAEDAKYYYTPSSGFSFDFFELFRRKSRMSKQQRKKHEEIIESY